MNRNKTQLFRKPLIHSVGKCFLSTTGLFAYSIVALLFSGLISCEHSSADESNSPPAITQPPLTIPLKLEDKYQINPFTGDSTFDKINMEGNVVETGVPIPAKGVVMSPEQYAKPVITKAGQPKRIANSHPNRNIIPVRQNVVPVDEDKLTKIPLGGGDPNSIIVNSHGDTIPSGVPLPLKGRTVPCRFPPLTKALPSVFKDAAFKDFSYLDVDQGLLMSFVMSIMEDSKGNIWFGTQGKGVSRYDGEYFTHFTTENGLVDGRIWSIVEDQKGNIWFGADHSGLSKFDGNAFTNFYEQEGLSINSVKSLLADSEDNIWIGSGGAGVSKIHGDSITHYGPKEGIPGKSVISIYQDRDENIWFGVYRTGVVRFDGKTFSQFTEEDGLMGSTPWDIIQDRVGQMWFGTDNGGFSKYDGKAFTQFTTPDGSPYNTIYALLEDHQGNICFATNGNGLQVFDGKEITQYATEEGLTSDIIWSMLKDSENNLWLGMIAGGAVRYNPNSFELFSEKQGLPSNIVFKTQQDSSGKIWFGYQGEGVCFYDGDDLYQYGAEEGMPLVAVEDILFDSKGNVWFTSYGMGVMKFDGTYFYHYTTAQGLAGDVVYSLAEDNDGNIWMGTENAGLSKYNGAYFTNFSEKEGLASNVVFKIIKAQNGHLWLASSGGGITEYDGQTFFHYSVKEGLPENNVWSILESSDHSIWVGTAGNGLCRFTPNSPEKTFTSYTKSSGQPEPDIFGLAEDRNNKIWGTGETGIICLSPNQNNPSTNEAITDYRITHLTKKDGLKSVSFFTNSILIDQNNHGWFGGGNGIAMLDLNTFKLSTQTPQPHLLQIEINNQLPDFRYIRDSMEQKKYFDSVASFQNYPLHPEIPFSKNHLAFYFSAIDWNAPNKVKYSFRIDGLNDNWSEPSKETKADYRNIPYGDYTFQVCAIGESQQWSEPINYAFTINPPWWHTWWARVGYLIAGLFAVIGIVRWRTAALRKEAKILEHKIDEATIVIRAQKEEVEAEKKISDDLLLNILPAEVAEELKQKGSSDAKHFDDVTVLFTDFKAFTEISEQLSARDLVDEINTCFSAFDHIMEKHNIEKIKTVGDSYMAAGGLPVPNNTNAKDAVLAALEIRDFMLSHHEGSLLAGKPGFEIRIGVNTGPVVAGIVGIKKFQYDLWGDTVNTASRMETASEPGKVNISQPTYRLLKDDPAFTFEHRGEIEVKGKGAIGMWFVELKK